MVEKCLVFVEFVAFDSVLEVVFDVVIVLAFTKLDRRTVDGLPESIEGDLEKTCLFCNVEAFDRFKKFCWLL